MHVVIFFTYDYSLKIWSDSGILNRELIYYKELLSKNTDLEITFVTYGDNSDLDHTVNLDRVNIIPIYSIINKNKFKIINYDKASTENFYLNNRKLMSKIKVSNNLENLKKDCLNLSKRLFK